jgi:IS30 family transposase
MISKWKAINPLTIHERRLIAEGIRVGMSYRQLGLHVGRHKSVVLREVKRLGEPSNYIPEKAQKDFEDKQKLVGKKK